jgi:hypothetical protein
VQQYDRRDWEDELVDDPGYFPVVNTVREVVLRHIDCGSGLDESQRVQSLEWDLVSVSR